MTRTDTAGARSFLMDGLGSTLALTDAAGLVQSEYAYELFGKTTATGAVSTNAFKYTGREDDGTGLYYYRARYYHPGLQRFISQDPIGFDGGDVNLYAYVAQNPISRIDPFGWWYIDFNGSWGSPTGVGLTGGFFIGPDGFHPYVGGGILLPPGPSCAINWSPGSPSPGMWSWQLGGAFGVGGAFGSDEQGNKFGEVGIGTPGGGLSWYYTY